ncbi:hypothetical protein [Kitasatospora phosalacinea]|uniref:BMP family ABC transporter substrate-binding protein n=1 Tax=Kitasatospora phosalacinea TaxID=2065 RepID=A0A9W6URY7_9ACTN|nr:hypothetical protein [Kitasatospora phosalacinea]GLW58859.1 hypothetical protein Kpho01_68690 [Kitasatospora phosalacinea]
MKLSFRPRPSRTLTLAAAAAALLVIAAALWPWPHDDGGAPAKTTANDYSLRPSACLAADDSTTSAPLVQHTWTALQQAGQDNQVNVQQLVIPAKDSTDAAPYLSGLIAQRCTMVVTVGAPFNTALPAIAENAPHVRFVAIDPPTGTDLKGATSLTPDQLDQLDQSLHSLLPQH